MCRRRSPTVQTLAFALLALLVGCVGDDDDADAGQNGVPRSVVIGHGDDEGQGFTALGDGDEDLLHYGSQGGFHVFFAARVTGFDERRLVFDIRAYRDDLGENVSANQMQRLLDLEPVGPDGNLVTTQADRLILCPSPTGIGSDGKPYRLWVNVRDSFGRTAHAEVNVTTVCPAEDDRCPPTCAGD